MRNRSWRFWVGALLIGGAILWAGFAFGLMPALVTAGYEQRSFSGWWDARFDGRADHPVGFYLSKWYTLAAAALIVWVGGLMLLLGVTTRKFRDTIIGTATPGRLGAIRVLVCLVLVWFAFHEQAHHAYTMSPEKRHTLGVMDLAYPAGFNAIAESPAGVATWRTATVAALLLAAVGIWTRPMLVLGGLGYLLLGGIKRSYLNFSHAGLLPLYLLAVLAVTRSGDGFSLQTLWRTWRGKPVADHVKPQTHYAWAVWTIFLVMSLWYTCAGLSKLRHGGLGWFDGINLKYHVIYDALRPGEAQRRWQIGVAHWPTWLFTIGATQALLMELFYPLVLVSRWARRIIPVTIAGMHLGIGVLMQIWFWDLVWMQAIFYRWDVLMRWVGRRYPPLVVMFDGECGFCRRARLVLQRLDLFRAIEWRDLRTEQPPTELADAPLSKDFHASDNGRTFVGFDAYRRIALRVPAFWLALPVLWLPFVSKRGRESYRYIADHRRDLMPPGETGATRPPLGPVRFGPAVVIALIVFQLSVWVFHAKIPPIDRWTPPVEWYPFTGVQMFSHADTTGTTEHYRAVATFADGRREVVYLQEMNLGTHFYTDLLADPWRAEALKPKTAAEFRRVATWWNERHADNPIVRLEAVKYRWDFANDPDGVEASPEVDVFGVEINE